MLLSILVEWFVVVCVLCSALLCCERIAKSKNINGCCGGFDDPLTTVVYI